MGAMPLHRRCLWGDEGRLEPGALPGPESIPRLGQSMQAPSIRPFPESLGRLRACPKALGSFRRRSAPAPAPGGDGRDLPVSRDHYSAFSERTRPPQAPPIPSALAFLRKPAGSAPPRRPRLREPSPLSGRPQASAGPAPEARSRPSVARWPIRKVSTPQTPPINSGPAPFECVRQSPLGLGLQAPPLYQGHAHPERARLFPEGAGPADRSCGAQGCGTAQIALVSA